METEKNDLVKWTKLFPREVSKDCISSGTFIKQFTKIIISCITYLKDAFAVDSYTVENIAGMNVHVLKNKCRDGDAQFLITSLLDAFEAFDKRYLRHLALYFYQNECRAEEVIESHVFEYSYKNDMPSVSVSSQSRGVQTKYSFQNIYKQTAHILKTYVVLMRSQPRLPLTYGLCLRLNYTEDTPSDYHAPGFEYDDDDVGQHNKLLKMGNVGTGFHMMWLYSYFKGREAMVAQKSQPHIEVCEVSEDIPGVDLLACECNKKDSGKHGLEGLLTCHYCSKRQHAACFGILSTDIGQVSQHCCAACHDADPARPATDLRLARLAQTSRASLSMFRRSLEWCMGLDTIDAPALGAGLAVSRAEAAKLLNILQHQRVIAADEDADLNKPQKIDTDKLKSIIAKYFNRKEENVVDRLLTEIEISISQEEFRLSDPIGKVLDSVQRSDIQNTSNICRVIDKPVYKPVAEDSTLQQYKEALVLDEIEEPVFSSLVEVKSNKRRQKTPPRASSRIKKAKN